MDAKFYPPIDYTPLLGQGKFAVYCATKEDAEHFVSRMICDHPARCKSWSADKVRFDEYENICYRPNLNTTSLSMKYCSIEWYEDEGYTIIPFESLMIESDIEESDLSIDVLLNKGCLL